MTEDVVREILHADDGAYTGNLSEKQDEKLHARFSLPHDGQRLFRRVGDLVTE